MGCVEIPESLCKCEMHCRTDIGTSEEYHEMLDKRVIDRLIGVG